MSSSLTPSSSSPTPSPFSLSSEPVPSSFHPARHFNHLTLLNNLVLKTSSATPLLGELYFYQNMPADIAHLFPHLHYYFYRPSSTHTLEFVRGMYLHQYCEKPSTLTLALDYVQGPTASSLLLSGRFETTHLDDVLRSLRAIHRSVGGGTNYLLSSYMACRDMMYRNYADKVLERWKRYPEKYERAGVDEGILERVVGLLRNYERERRGAFVLVIHGDSVLTNVIMSPRGPVWVDPRGMIGEEGVLYGDEMYDWGKVLQSLLGYDWIVGGKGEWKSVDLGRIRELVGRVREEVGEERWDDVLVVVVGLVMSLIGLHEGEIERFGMLLRRILQWVEGEGVGDLVGWVGGVMLKGAGGSDCHSDEGVV